MDKKHRRRLRLMKLCRKYGYRQTEELLRKRLAEEARRRMLDGPPLLFNLSSQQENED